MTTLHTMRYGWGDGATDRTQPFWLAFSRCRKEPETWDKEIRAAAVDLANSTKKPIWICFSGGVDSEAICDVFLELKIPFNVLTLAFENNLNEHDIVYAREWCANNKVEQKIVSFNPEDFGRRIPKMLEQGYAADHFFRFYQIHLLELVEDMGGFAILGGGEQLYDLSGRPPERRNLALNMDVGFTVPLEWCKKNGAFHEPYFYFSRPEVMLAWLRVPLVAFCLDHPEILVHPQNKYVLKIMAMRVFFTKQKWRLKFNGFEKVEHIRQRVQRELRQTLGRKNQVYQLPVSDLIEQLQPDAAIGRIRAPSHLRL
jgi:Asparagine synthase